jgi:Aldo/keto reductase family
VTLFDTADTYGAGHSERVLGRALGDRRDAVVIATKWGNTSDPETRQATGSDASPEYLRGAVRASLTRLGTDHIDLYQLHLNDLPVAQALELIPALEELVSAGLIRAYAWSTDHAASAEAFARAGAHVTAVQHDLSVLHDAPEVLAVCAEYDLASIDRGPLGMGLLTGEYMAESRLGRDDARHRPAVAGAVPGRPAGPAVAGPGGGGTGDPAQRRPHARPGSPGLPVGAQRPHHPDPGLPHGGPGGGERRGAAVRAAAAGAGRAGAHRARPPGVTGRPG